MRGFFAGVAVFLLAAAAIAAEGDGKSAFDKATLESYVRYMLMWGDQINVSITDPAPSEVPGLQQVTVRGSAGAASRDLVLYVGEDGQKILQGNVFDINKNPFQNDLDKISTYMQPSMGPSGAPVMIVLFTDFECPYCAQEAAMLRRYIPQNYPERVRVVFKDFPLESIHPWAKAAAIAGQCVYRQSEGAFWEYYDSTYSQQQSITDANFREKLMEFAKGQGSLDVAKLGSCFDERQTEKAVNASIAEGQALQINATPTMFVNGRRFSGDVPWQNLQQIIEFELNNGDLLGTDEEDCCVVDLPTPMSQ